MPIPETTLPSPLPHNAPGPALSAVLRPYYLLLAFFIDRRRAISLCGRTKAAKLKRTPLKRPPFFLSLLSLASPLLSCIHFALPPLFCQFFIWFSLANCCKNSSTFFVWQVKIEFCWGYWKINWNTSWTIEKRRGGVVQAIIVLIKFSNQKANMNCKLAWFYVLV